MSGSVNVHSESFRLCVLGPLRLESERETVTRFRTASTAALLTYLALYPDTPHSREKLTALFWPDASSSAGRNNLSVSLHYLRGMLASTDGDGRAQQEVIRADRDFITLNPGFITVDADRFERLLARARRASDASARDELVVAAVALYRGAFLEGLNNEWIEQERRRFEALYDEITSLRMISTPRRFPEAKTPPVWDHPAVGPVSSSLLPSPVDGVVSLPHRLSRFFARETEIATLCDWLQRYRLVTLTGPGGVGKTRLSEQTARHAADQMKRRIRYVPLEAWNDSRRLEDALTAALRLTVTGSSPSTVLAAFLTAEPTLLLLDNLEHLLPDAGPFVERLLQNVPSLVCLATSRRSLHIEGERVFRVAPLPLPTEKDRADAVSDSPAIALFLDRARAARPDFHLTERNREAVVALCRALDGMPLAIELAAARVLTLTPERMRQELAQNSERLLSRHRGGTARHRSLHAAIAWSYRLLTPEAQRFFAALSVFAGGWTAEAAEAITGNPLTVDLLAELTDDSLLKVAFPEHDGRAVRFTMLETVREYARKQLPEVERVHLAQRHADYFLAEAETHHEELHYGDYRKASRFFRFEEANVRIALETLRADPEKHLRMATAMYFIWSFSAPALGETLLSPAWHPIPGVADGVRARALLSLSGCLVALGTDGVPATRAGAAIFHSLGDTLWYIRCRSSYDGQEAFEENLALAQSLGDHVSAAHLFNSRGVALWHTGQIDEADRCFAEALRYYQRANSVQNLPGVLCEWGYSLSWRGELRRARPLLQEAIRIFQEIDHEDAHPSTILANVELGLGNYSAAEALARHSATLRRSLGPTALLFGPLRNLCIAQIHQGKYTEARETLAELDAAVRAMGRERLQVDMGIASMELAWAEGNDQEALAIAQETVEVTVASSGPANLSTCDFWAGTGLAITRAPLAHAELRAGLPDIARETLQEILRFRRRFTVLGRAISDIEGIAASLVLEYSTGPQAERAARLLAAAHVLRLRGGTPLPPSHAAFFNPIAASLKTAHPDAWRAGTRLSLDQAIAETLEI